MAFSTEKNREDYPGNDAATSFPLRFPWQLDADVAVLITNTLVTPNVEYPLVLDVDYSLAGAGESSGTLTHPITGSAYPVLPTGWIITARRVPAMTQETDFQPGDGVPPEPLEDCLDRAIMVCGALQEQINRCLSLPTSYSGAPLAVPAPVANAVLTWNPTATTLVNGPTIAQISSAEGYAAAAQVAETNAEDAELGAVSAKNSAEGFAAAAADSADEAAAAVGTVQVSLDDTTAGYLDGKLALASNSGLLLVTVNPAGNEHLTLEAKLKSNAGLVKDADGLAFAAGRAEAIRRAYLPANAFTPTATNGATPGTNEYATNDIMADYLAFSGSTEQFAGLNLVMPPEWDRGTIKFKVYWAPGDAACTAGDTVEWEIAGGSLSDGDTIDAALGTAQVISDTVLAGKNAALHVSGATPALTIGGSPALGELIPLKLSRNVSGTDDMTEDAWLFGVVVEYSVSNAVPAW